MLETVGGFAPIFEALGSLGTFIIAIFVLVQAKSIRRAEGIFRQNQVWNDLGYAVASLHKGSSIGDLLLGKTVSGNLTPKDAFLLMSFFNVVSSEYNGVRAKAIDEQYVMHSLTMTSRIVKANKDWIFTFLRDYGYEMSFRRVVAIVALTSDEVEGRKRAIRREMIALSVWGRICGPGFRTWLRRHLKEHEVQALCDGNDERVGIVE